MTGKQRHGGIARPVGGLTAQVAAQVAAQVIAQAAMKGGAQGACRLSDIII